MKAPVWVRGNHVELLENGEAYFPRLLEAIDAATVEIFVETFIFFDDEIGQPVQQALIRAAERGCRVEVTVDGYGTATLPEPFIAAMTAVGIHYHVYRPQPPIFGVRTNLFRRLHRKIVVVDGSRAFVGGINISHDHVASFGEGSKQDYAIEITGPIVQQIHKFCELTVAKFAARPQERRHWWQRRRAVQLPEPARPDTGNVLARFVTRDNERHHDDIERIYREGIKGARRRIIIANAYFFPGWRLLRNLRDAAKRGVDVTLILQGKPDMWYVKWVAQNLYESLMKSGITIYEYCQRPLHAKVAVIDDEWSTVGSSNLDPLSLYLNLESNLVFRDATFNAQLASSLRELMTHGCRKVDWAAIPKRDLGRAMFTFVTYHLGRRFPAWVGWRPAHAEELAKSSKPLPTQVAAEAPATEAEAVARH